jgi:SAM-dependent methyltransferase
MLLRPEDRTKLDNTNDHLFYRDPRLVTHVDEGFIDRLTQLYQTLLQPNTKILDLMSSWISHLPPDMEFAEVVGHGMNAAELEQNSRLDRYIVQNLNTDLELPFADQYFDAVLNTVSVQYLQYPEAIFSEIHRILKPGGIAIFSFSNRMFYQKAIAAWRDRSEIDRVELVCQYFNSVSGFEKPQYIIERSSLPSFLQMVGLGGGDPFYAVMARRSDGAIRDTSDQ